MLLINKVLLSTKWKWLAEEGKKSFALIWLNHLLVSMRTFTNVILATKEKKSNKIWTTILENVACVPQIFGLREIVCLCETILIQEQEQVC